MKDFVKKTAKGVGNIGGKMTKAAFSAVMTEIAKELLEESGAKDIAKDKIMETGTKILKNMDVDTKNLQKELLKNAIRKELNI